jgi:hypothetical protein
MVTVVNDALEKLLALLRSSAAVPENVSKRYRAIWVPEQVETHKSWETTRASQIEHYEIRVELDALMRRDGTKPTKVGFEAMLSGIMPLPVTGLVPALVALELAATTGAELERMDRDEGRAGVRKCRMIPDPPPPLPELWSATPGDL